MGAGIHGAKSVERALVELNDLSFLLSFLVYSTSLVLQEKLRSTRLILNRTSPGSRAYSFSRF